MLIHRWVQCTVFSNCELFQDVSNDNMTDNEDMVRLSLWLSVSDKKLDQAGTLHHLSAKIISSLLFLSCLAVMVSRLHVYLSNS